MYAMKLKSRFTCRIVLLICMTAVLLYSVPILDLSPQSDVLAINPSEETFNINRKKLSGLQVLEPAQFDNQPDVNCVNATVGKLAKFGILRFPMCLYNTDDDIYISRKIIIGKYFESYLVQKMLRFFRMNPNVSFVDLGANLGIYSLPIAHSGIHVVSVEPNKDTVRRLAKSVHLGRIENNIDILHYALSNEETTTFLEVDAVNRGDTFMADNGSCPGCLSARVTILNKLIPFIRHKKAVIKIDTQEAEIKIFQRKSAGKFFDEIDVVMIQMEWVHHANHGGKTEEGRRRIDRFLEFFYQRGYTVYDDNPRTEKKLGADWTKWTADVLFKKEDLPKDELFAI